MKRAEIFHSFSSNSLKWSEILKISNRSETVITTPAGRQLLNNMNNYVAQFNRRQKKATYCNIVITKQLFLSINYLIMQDQWPIEKANNICVDSVADVIIRISRTFTNYYTANFICSVIYLIIL